MDLQTFQKQNFMQHNMNYNEMSYKELTNLREEINYAIQSRQEQSMRNYFSQVEIVINSFNSLNEQMRQLQEERRSLVENGIWTCSNPTNGTPCEVRELTQNDVNSTDAKIDNSGLSECEDNVTNTDTIEVLDDETSIKVKKEVSRLQTPFYVHYGDNTINEVLQLGNLNYRENYVSPDETRVYSSDGIAPTLTATHSDIIVSIGEHRHSAEFNPTEFLSQVAIMRKNLRNIISDANCKNYIRQVMINNGYDYKDAYNYLQTIVSEQFHDFQNNYIKRKWDSIYTHYIKRAEAEYDWNTAHTLRGVLDGTTSTGMKREQEMKEQFFAYISDKGIDPVMMELDMCFDLFGWRKIMKLIIAMVEDKHVDEVQLYGFKMPASEREALSKRTEITKKGLSCASKGIAKKGTKTRNRIKYTAIQQLSLDGTLIKVFKTISEAAKATKIKHPSISKCISGIYKTAGDYRFVGVMEEPTSITCAA